MRLHLIRRKMNRLQKKTGRLSQASLFSSNKHLICAEWHNTEMKRKLWHTGVEPFTGIEPATYGLQNHCSADWARKAVKSQGRWVLPLEKTIPKRYGLPYLPDSLRSRNLRFILQPSRVLIIRPRCCILRNGFKVRLRRGPSVSFLNYGFRMPVRL